MLTILVFIGIELDFVPRECRFFCYCLNFRKRVYCEFIYFAFFPSRQITELCLTNLFSTKPLGYFSKQEKREDLDGS